DMSGSTTSWNSADTSVATVNSVGTVECVGVGSTSIVAYFTAVVGYGAPGVPCEPHTTNMPVPGTLNVAATWTLGEVRFTTDSASPSSPGKLKVVVTEGQRMPTTASVTLQISFQATQGGPLAINISPDEGQTVLQGQNPRNAEARESEYTFAIPQNQGSGNAIVTATAKLVNPTGGSSISGMTDRMSSNTLIVNK